MTAIEWLSWAWRSAGSNLNMCARCHAVFIDSASSVFWSIAAPFVIYHYAKTPTLFPNSRLLCAKMLGAGLLIAIKSAYVNPSDMASDWSLAVELLAAVATAGIIYMEHRRSAEPSILLGACLTFDVAYDLTNHFSSSEISKDARSNASLPVTIVLKLALLTLQHMRKQPVATDERIGSAFQQRSYGFLPQLTSLFFDSLLEIGRALRVLIHGGESSAANLQPAVLHEEISIQWPPTLADSSLRSGALFIACFRAWIYTLPAILVCRVAVSGFHCIQPFALQRVIRAVGLGSDDGYAALENFRIAFVVSFIFFGLAVTKACSSYLINVFAARVRGGLISLQLHKLHTLAEEDSKRASATLINADIESIAVGIPQCLEVLFALLEAYLGSSLLAHFTEVSMIWACSPLVLGTMIFFQFARLTGKQQENWKRAASARVASTSNVLQKLTAIRMLGLGPTLTCYLQHLRQVEITISNRAQLYGNLAGIPCALGDFGPQTLTIGLALAGSAFNGEMTASKVFPALASTMVIQRATVVILHSTRQLMGLFSSFSRIQAFLATADRAETRLLSENNGEAQEDTSTEQPDPIIRFSYVDIAPSGRSEPLLRGVNFELTRGSVTGVVGPPGAGKSTILNGLLNRSEILAGSLHVESCEIGYCSEEPWLQDTTIRANIIGELEYDEERFLRAARSAFLEEDLEWLPGGAEFGVGANGSYLSDGQRHRVAIARVAYAQCTVTLIDDVFRFLDEETAICILHQLCGRNSILRQAGCTVLVATTLPQCVEVVDQLLFLDGQGHTNLDRTYREPPHPRRIMNALSKLNKNRNLPVSLETKQQNAMRRYLQTGAPGSRSAVRDPLVSRWKLYAVLIRQAGHLWAFLNLFLLLLFVTSELLPDVSLAFWTASFPRTPTLFPYYASVQLVPISLGILADWANHRLFGSMPSINLHQRLLRATIGSSQLAFVNAPKIAELMSLFGTDMMALPQAIPQALFKAQYAGFSAVVYFAILFYVNPYAWILLPGLFIYVLVVCRSYVRSSRETRKWEASTERSLQTHFEETATGSTLISAFGQQEDNLRHGMELLADSQYPFFSKHVTEMRVRFSLDFMVAVVAGVTITCALSIPGASSETSIGLFYFGLLNSARSFYEAFVGFAHIDLSFDSLERVFALTEVSLPTTEPEYAPLPDNWPSIGSVELQNVFACYTPGVGATPCLRRISLSVRPAEHVGISGGSGSGKTSLCLGILGFIHYGGTIKIDGVEISSIAPNELRSRLVTIAQEQVVLDGSVRANLLPRILVDTSNRGLASIYQDADLEQLLKRLHIWTPLVTKGGLDAALDAVKYSKAELQLLCIARAIIRQRETGSKVVLVDDATSELTALQEKVANRVMAEYFATCTMLRTSSRQSGFRRASRVVRLRRGAIVGENQIAQAPDSGGEEGDSGEEEQ